MTPDQITQLRQLLKSHCKKCRIRDDRHYIKISACGIIECDISKALALLPCPTCNGTEMVNTGDADIGDGIKRVGKFIDCPDCQ